jgi:hypothetical protein
MKFYGNINLRDNEMQKMVLQTETDFPLDPIVGRVIFRNKRVWSCIENITPTWVPLGGQVDTYVHVQDQTDTVWSVEHNLDAAVPVVQIYDDNGNMIIPEDVEIIDENNVVVTLNEGHTGIAVVMFGNTDKYMNMLYPRWSYEHTQSTPSTAWVIRHNLGYAPIVRVFTEDDEEILPKSITVDDIFQVTIRFENVTSGRARLI